MTEAPDVFEHARLHAQEAEAAAACNVLNRMRVLGWPQSVKVAQ